ncbi:MAG: hydantoinase B/oxoprolinase family protein [Pirellulales bacterium]
MSSRRWEFSIDVGGTFTDVIARAPDGRVPSGWRRLKLLSSGVTKGRVGAGSTQTAIVDPARCGDPPEFWTGWRLAILDEAGATLWDGEVTGFDSGSGRLQVLGLQHDSAVGAHYELRSTLEAPVVAIRYLMALPLAEPVPPVVLRLGTTRGTNALITRRGARAALVTTQGFGDVLEIGYQARPRLFDLTIRKPSPLTAAVVEIHQRMTHSGEVLAEPREAEVRRQLEELRATGVKSLAICLLHADRHPAHEELVARVAREVGFTEVSVSHLVAPLPKLVARADTTVVDAYLNPVLREYVARLAESLPGSQIRLLTSAGGLVAAGEFRGKDSILSGPAGGVVGFSRAAQAAGFTRAIGFDMGGTSTDVARFDAARGGRFELEYETEKAGVRLFAPTMAIETVAAGGGSICRFDGVKLVVGPESAGADPGPACYGRGGPLTVTDCNLVLGRIDALRFPFPLDEEAARERLGQLAAEAASPSGASASGSRKIAVEELAAGLVRIANANMAAAIRLVSVAKGANPAEHLLVAFGSAAPQHACAVAAELGMPEVLVHPDAGILSAVGIGLADVVRHRSLGVERKLDAATLEEVAGHLDALELEARRDVLGEGVAEDKIAATRSLDLRYQGVDSYLTIPWPADDDFAREFAAAHRQRYGYVYEGRPLEIAAARVEVMGRVAASLVESKRADARQPCSMRTTRAWFDGQLCDVPQFERSALVAGDQIVGPALISEAMSTTVVDVGWTAEQLSGGELLLTAVAGELRSPGAKSMDNNLPATGPRSGPAILGSAMAGSSVGGPDVVFLEVFNNQLASIASQMGVTLRNTASSVNVNERLDFSCAIFTADGRLVANAPHVPVHLGAMEETVRHVLAANPDMRPGDVFCTNDPYAGGSHLPDITVVTPVYKAPGERLFVTANRAHHAEIGGIAPGSMPPLSTKLAEEGVLVRNLKLVAAGESRFEELERLLTESLYPSRNVAANLADVAAQVAANRQGASDLLALAARYTEPVVAAYLEYVQDAAEQKVRQALEQLPRGTRTFVDYLETAVGESVPMVIRLTVDEPGCAVAATLDFAGTGPVVAGNLNANRAIVTAAVIYVLRLLVNEDIPLNHGVLRPIELLLPECLLNPRSGATPGTTPAVAGGNVETSQRVVDVLLGALGIAGASQGTMNNLLFGDESFGYYETICGGSGATADGPGASAVQVHMTNTRLTDPEILERRFPVRVRKFAIRRGSGGAGAHRGGDGVVRELEFLRPLTVSLITERRGPHPPYGAAGGAPGALGGNRLTRADGAITELPGIIQLTVGRGDVLLVETPGGGGYGKVTTTS